MRDRICPKLRVKITTLIAKGSEWRGKRRGVTYHFFLADQPTLTQDRVGCDAIYRRRHIRLTAATVFDAIHDIEARIRLRENEETHK
jgi:hypothetical protein